MHKNESAPGPVRNVLFQDRSGCLQVLLARDAMLDVDAVQKQTGRDLLAVPQEQLAAVIRRHQLISMETPAGCFRLPMLVDSTIPEDQRLTLIGAVEAQTDGDAFTLASLMQSLRQHRYRLSRASVSVAPEKLRAEVADASAMELTSIVESDPSLSGLLHNFGYLVLAHLFPPHFSRICRYAEANPSISHVAIDHHLVGVSREQISAWLMQCWSMPEELSVALRWQHDPEYDGNHAVYAHLILIALRLLREHGIGDAPPERVPDALYERYRLDPRDAGEAVTRVAGSPDIPVMAKQLGS